MDHIYSALLCEEGAATSSYESQLDYMNYWSDRTVEDAVNTGHRLRLQKTRPVSPHDYNNLHLKPPISSRRRRKKSLKSHAERRRSQSPNKPKPQSHKRNLQSEPSVSKRNKNRQKAEIYCAMRIAELAVPTKRHCLETWKNKCHTLPDYMVDRLRERVTDQRPIVQVSDAIYCFKKKCKKQKKAEPSFEKAMKSRRKILKNLLSKKDLRILSAIFGHKITKKLVMPMKIILNSDLERLAKVITYDIENLMMNSKITEKQTKLYKVMEEDVAKKVTVWVANILEEASDKILEDQLKDFEEEAGPALDAVDDILDNVLDICMPIPEFVEQSMSESEGSSLEEITSDKEISSEKVDLEDAIEISIENYFKNEIIALINNIVKDGDVKSDEYLDIEDGDAQPLNEKYDEYNKAEEGIDVEQTEGEEEKHSETNDNIAEIDGTQHLENSLDLLEQNENPQKTELEGIDMEQTEGGEEKHYSETNDNIAEIDGTQNLENSLDLLEQNENPGKTDLEGNENEGELEQNNDELGEPEPPTEEVGDDTVTALSEHNIENETAEQQSEGIKVDDENEDEYLESEDQSQPPEIPPGNSDETTETFADATEGSKAEEGNITNNITEESSSDIDRKVTFDASVTEETNENKVIQDLNWKASIEHIEFAEPNEDLLTDADESWPEDVQPPIIRPSQSVSKSITSLGRIKEVEEKNYPEESTTVGGTDSPGTKTQDKTKSAADEDGKVKTTDSSVTGSIKTKDKTSSKDSGRNKARSNKLSDSKKDKTQSTKPSTHHQSISSSRRPTIPSKVGTAPTIVKPIPKTDNKLKSQAIKLKSKKSESPKTSKSVKDIESDVKPKEDQFSSVRVKPKPNYRVNIQTAPLWVNRNFGEPSCSCSHIASKPKGKPQLDENLLKRWCRDLEHGYENLKMWNDWVDNTAKTVSMLQREIDQIANTPYCAQKCAIKDWTKMKRNIDKDAGLWQKLNLHTREKLKCYRKMYQKRSQIPNNTIICCSQPKKPC